MINSLLTFLQNSLTPYHACDNVKEHLVEHGFTELYETEDWALAAGGKYFVLRGGSSLIAFTVGSLDEFSFKIAASHVDSPALKLKENPLKTSTAYTSLNVEPYGGGLWYTFLDRPLRLAGRVVVQEGERLLAKTVCSPFLLTIPSLAIHQNRGVNDNLSINPQVDLLPLLGVNGEELTEQALFDDLGVSDPISYDLFFVNATLPYAFGLKEEFISSPRIDNLTSAWASMTALAAEGERSGICVAALMDSEETGSLSPKGADGDFLKNTLKRVAYALRFDESEYYKGLASSYLLSLDNAHAMHPNHPETSDPTNVVTLGKGIVIKSHAGRAYCTDAMSSAIIKSVFDGANVPYQTFFNRSDLKSGSTLGSIAQRHIGVAGADIGIPQLAMHSAAECCAKADCLALVTGLTAFFQTTIVRTDEGACVK